MALIAAPIAATGVRLATGAIGRLFGGGGHTDVAGETDPNVPKIRAITDANVLEIIAEGGTLQPAPAQRWLGMNGRETLNFSDGKVGRQYERQVAQDTLDALRAGRTPTAPRDAPASAPTASQQAVLDLEAAANRAGAAAVSELAARNAVAASRQAAEQGTLAFGAQREESRLSIMPSGTTVAIVLAVVGLVLLVVLMRRS